MSTEMHPQVTEALRQAQRFQSALDGHINRTNTESFTATDEAKTVEVKVDGHGWLTGLFIADGVLRLGSKTVQQRVIEALRNAQAASTATVEAEQEQLIASLGDIADELQKELGLI